MQIESKRGQSANQAAIVIILIAVMIVLYILFLPPEDRAQLLGEDTGTGGPGANGAKSTLMSKTPGRIYPAGSNTIEHKLPSFLVYTSTNANELKRTDSLYTRNSVFGAKRGELVFFYDAATTDDLKLSFNTLSASGRLKIILNGREIFEGNVAEGSPAPITLPKEYLVGKNTLTFEVSSPGLIFWTTNAYSLESVVISGTVTDYTGSRSEQHFSIADTEFEKLEKSTFEFLPDCPPREDGQLHILLNARPIYATVPDCGIKATIEVSKDFLQPGDNTIVATTSRGSFLIDAPKVTTFMKEAGQPVFYFTAPPGLLDALYSGQRGILLTLRFVDSTNVKRGVIEVNGIKTSFETQSYLYQTPLEIEAIQDGSNGVRIVPISGAMDIVELRIDVI